MNQKIVIAIVAVLIIIIGAVYYLGGSKYGAQNSPVNNAPQTPNSQGANQISIKNFAFSPNVLNINAGDTVTWVNNDSVPHRIEGSRIQMSNSEFQSGDLSNGQSYSFTFNAAGTYDYICSIHPSMKGKIIVK